MNKEKLRFNLYYFWYKVKTPVIVILAIMFFPITIIWGAIDIYFVNAWDNDYDWCHNNNYQYPFSKKHGWLGDFEEHRIVKGWKKRARKVERIRKKMHDISIVKDMIKDVDNRREFRRLYKNLENAVKQ